MAIEQIEFRHTWRPSQARVLQAIRHHLLDDRLHVVAAPGAGKTTLGLECFRLIGEPALVLSPTRTIRDQWIERLRDFLPADEPFPPAWVSSSLEDPGLFTSVTYQALHTKHRLAQLANEEAETEDGDDDDADEGSLDSEEVLVLVELILAAGIRTIILDEAHHLRAEWWIALAKIVEQVEGMKVVSLTATPPYDSSPAEWARYEKLCGPIDEEISVPELVKSQTLCPHQDYVWTVVPIESEAQALNDYEDAVEALIAELQVDPVFLSALGAHGWLSFALDPDDLLSDLELAFSLYEIARDLDVGDIRPLEDALDIGGIDFSGPEIGDWQRVVKAYLFASVWLDTEEVTEHRKALARRLRREGLLHGRELRLATSRLAKRELTQSASKLDACVSIHAVERNLRGTDLRMVVLTDYIRDDDLDEVAPTSRVTLGAVPIFRAFADELPESDRVGLALLTGRVCLIHQDKEALLRAALKTDRVTFEPLESVAGFVRIIGPSSGDLTSALTQLLEAGEVRILVGTRSLLGEGWDAPCINALVLASSVGSFMLTNQMRGRAIRVDKSQPEKVASIWHIVAFALNRPRSLLARQLWLTTLYWPGLADFVELRRRFETFSGLDVLEGQIENGILRVPLLYIREDKDKVTGFEDLQFNLESFNSPEALKSANTHMISYRSRIKDVSEGWKTAVEGASVGRMMPEVHTKDAPRFAGFHLRHTLAYLLSMAVIVFMAVTYASARVTITQGSSAVFVGLLIAALATAWPLSKAAKLWLFHLPVDGTVHQIGVALLEAMCATEIIETPFRQLGVSSRSMPMGGAAVHLEGGTYYERSLFADSIAEILGEVASPRYLLVRGGRSPLGHRVYDYHSVPQLLAIRKERAEQMARSWRRRVGPTELVYTRTAATKRVLLRARARSFATVSRKATARLERWM